MPALDRTPRDLQDISGEWLHAALSHAASSVLPPINDIEVNSLGDQSGALATIGRARLTFEENSRDLPTSVIIKLASPLRRSRSICRLLSLYRREYDYYARLAPKLPIPSPKMLYGEFRPRGSTFILVLEDLEHMAVYDQITGPSPSQARLAVQTVAKMHAHYWNKPEEMAGLFDTRAMVFSRLTQLIYRASTKKAIERTEELTSVESRRLMQDYGPRLAGLQNSLSEGNVTLTHGDFRIENLFFSQGEPNEEISVIDWQACGIGAALYDIAYFLAGSLPIDVRRQLERELIGTYHETLCAEGVENFSLEECWLNYRRNMLGTLMPIVAAWGFLDAANERMVEVLKVGVERISTALDDLNVAEFLPPRRSR